MRSDTRLPLIAHRDADLEPLGSLSQVARHRLDLSELNGRVR